VKLAKGFFSRRSNGKRMRTGFGKPKTTKTSFIKQKNELEQAHLVLATPFIPATSDKRYAADLLVNIIGGGTSSRLWQKVREERGLAYSVGASGALYQDAGVFSIYAGTSPDQVQEVVDIALDEMRWIVREGVTETELELAKSQSISAIVLGLEDSGVRAGTLARMEMVHGKQISVEDSLRRTREVKASEVRSLARQFFREENISFAAIGNLPKRTGFRV
jgi:predicted Zn-dependent peptidase